MRSKAGSKGGSKTQANRLVSAWPAYANENANENEDAKGPRFPPESRVAIQWLNERSGKKFRETETNLAFISARLEESEVDIDGVKKMIARQCKLWKGNAKMEQYLRPETLFNKTKFDSYYAAKDLPIPNGDPNSKENPRNFGMPSTAQQAGERAVAELKARGQLRGRDDDEVAG